MIITANDRAYTLNPTPYIYLPGSSGTTVIPRAEPFTAPDFTAYGRGHGTGTFLMPS